jgi:hypothetical protein
VLLRQPSVAPGQCLSHSSSAQVWNKMMQYWEQGRVSYGVRGQSWDKYPPMRRISLNDVENTPLGKSETEVRNSSSHKDPRKRHSLSLPGWFFRRTLLQDFDTALDESKGLLMVDSCISPFPVNMPFHDWAHRHAPSALACS